MRRVIELVVLAYALGLAQSGETSDLAHNAEVQPSCNPTQLNLLRTQREEAVHEVESLRTERDETVEALTAKLAHVEKRLHATESVLHRASRAEQALRTARGSGGSGGGAGGDGGDGGDGGGTAASAPAIGGASRASRGVSRDVTKVTGSRRHARARRSLTHDYSFYVETWAELVDGIADYRTQGVVEMWFDIWPGAHLLADSRIVVASGERMYIFALDYTTGSRRDVGVGQVLNAIIDGQDQTDLFEVEEGATLEMAGIHLTRGRSISGLSRHRADDAWGLHGGAITVRGSLFMFDCEISLCSSIFGGAIYAHSETNSANLVVETERVTIRDSAAVAYPVPTSDAPYVADGSTSDETWGRYYGSLNMTSAGGAMFFGDVNSVRIRNCEFIRCESDDRGGALWIGTNDLRDVEVTGSLFQENKAATQGGAIYFNSMDRVSYVLLHDSSFVKNEAPLGAAFHASEDDYVTIASLHIDHDCQAQNHEAGTQVDWWHVFFFSSDSSDHARGLSVATFNCATSEVESIDRSLDQSKRTCGYASLMLGHKPIRRLNWSCPSLRLI